jgi:hypothetical protein
VSTKPGGAVTRAATGIPPHVKTNVKLLHVIDLCSQTLQGVKDVTENLQEDNTAQGGVFDDSKSVMYFASRFLNRRKSHNLRRTHDRSSTSRSRTWQLYP